MQAILLANNYKLTGSPSLYKQEMLERVWRKGNALALLVGV